jgi:protease secretion system membrane fusion protein
MNLPPAAPPSPPSPRLPSELEDKPALEGESSPSFLGSQVKRFDKKAESWIQSWNPYSPEATRNKPLPPVMIEESQIRKTAAKFFLIAFIAFMIWAALAPIDNGVTTTGTVIVSGYRKALQHPTGGVVQEILVKEGQEVNEGDILIRINPLKAEADLTGAQLQYINVLVTEARLMAERSGEKKISWPAELQLMGKEDPRVIEAMHTQQKLFETRYREYGMALKSRKAQLVSLTEEANSALELAKEGYVPRAQANQAERLKIEAEMSLNTLQATYFKDVDGQLAEVQKNRDALKTRLDAIAYDRDLTSIRAPVTGTVVGLKINTVGGTIPAGQVLAEIVPKEAVLIVDAQVPPQLIDKVKKGTGADLRFTSFNVNTTPVIPGKVILIGADRRPNETPQAEDDTYLAQVEATKEGIEKLGDLQVHPGMPVDVVFKTGERTFLSYLLKPLLDKMAKAFQDI